MIVKFEQERNIKYFNLLLLGAVLFSNVENFQNYVLGKSLILRSFSILGLFLYWYSFLKLPKLKYGSKKYGPILLFFSIVGVITILRLNPNSELTLYRRMMMESYLWTYLMPFLLYLRIDSKYIKYCLYWILVQIFLDFIFLGLNFSTIVQTSGIILGAYDPIIIDRFSVSAGMVAPIIAFCYVMSRFKIQWQLIIVLALVLSIISSMLGGRRSSSMLMVFSLLLIVASYVKRTRNLVALLVVVLFVLLSGFNLMDLLADKFELMSSRLTEDTRSGTEVDFYKDFELLDWIFGRGMDGTYKSLSVSLVDTLNRNLIETGYLNLILHGGLLFLIPYLYFLLLAIYKGLVKTKNPFVKSFGLYVAIHLLYLYPGGTPSLNLRYTILFVLIGFCINSNRIKENYDFDISPKIIRKHFLKQK